MNTKPFRIRINQECKGNSLYYTLIGNHIFLNPKGKMGLRYSPGCVAIAGESPQALVSQQRCLAQLEADKKRIYDLRHGTLGADTITDADNVRDALQNEASKDGYNISSKKLKFAAAKHINDFFEDGLPVDDIYSNVVIDFYNYLINTKSLSHASAVSYSNELKRIASKIIKHKGYNIILDRIIPHSVIREPIRNWFTSEELGKIFHAPSPIATVDVIRRAALVSAYTGLRYNDILDLKCTDITTEKTKKGQEMFIKKIVNKTGKNIRVYLPVVGRKIIEQELTRSRGPHESRLFALPQYGSVVSKRLKTALEGAGITRKCLFHDFRRTFCSLCLKGGVSLPKIQTAMGHSSIHITQRYIKIEGLNGADAEKISAIK